MSLKGLCQLRLIISLMLVTYKSMKLLHNEELLYFSGSCVANFMFFENCGKKCNKYTGMSLVDVGTLFFFH